MWLAPLVWPWTLVEAGAEVEAKGTKRAEAAAAAAVAVEVVTTGQRIMESTL